MALGCGDILSGLSLPVREAGVSFRLSVSLISSAAFCSFQCASLSTSRFIPEYFIIFFDVIMNKIVF